MSEKNFALLRDFTGEEGELPCDNIGNKLFPGIFKLFTTLGWPIKLLPMAWLEGKPVYPDSPICWDRGVQLPAEGWCGWDDPDCLARFSWGEPEQEPDCDCDFCKAFRGAFSSVVFPIAPPAQDKRTAAIQEQLDIQGQDGNWNYDPYMHGLYNGLECALATLEGRDPKYRDVPDVWLRDITPAPVAVDCYAVAFILRRLQ